jgi:hypothetical protein
MQEGDGISTPAADEPGCGDEARLQEPEHDLRREVEALRAEVKSLRERVEAVEGKAAQGRGRGVDYVDVGGVDEGDRDRQRRSVPAPRPSSLS